MRPLWVCVLALGVVAAGCADSGARAATVQSSAAGVAISVDWRSHASKSDEAFTANWTWGASGGPNPPPVMTLVDLVDDRTFGRVARITQRPESESPQLRRSLPQPLADVWVRFRIRFSPGWTARGSQGASQGAAYKVMHLYMVGGGSAGRTRIEVENGTQFGCGFGFPGRRYVERPLPGHQPGGLGCGTATAAGGVGDEFNDGEWYEWIVHHETTGPTTGRVQYWHRRLTQGGVIVNNRFRYSGWSVSGMGDADAFPKVREIKLGINKNRRPDQLQYIFWGPWELVDGSVNHDPFGVAR